MKKVLALLGTALIALLIFSCDMGTSGSDPVNPTEPVETLAVGSLTLTLDDPGVETVADGVTPRAVVTGSSANGATFKRVVSLDTDSVSITIANLLVGDWNIKVKLWDGSEDIVALAYETAVVPEGENVTLSALFWMKDDLAALLDSYYDEAVPVDAHSAISEGLFELMADDEEMALNLLSFADAGNISEIGKYLTFLTDGTSFATVLEEFLSTEIYDGMTTLDILNYLWGGESYEAGYYVSLFSNLLDIIFQEVVGDFTFLFYDLVDVTVSSDTEGFSVGANLPDVETVNFSASSDYSEMAGFEYTWFLNGVQVGTGMSFDMATADCLDGLNYLSAEMTFGVDGTSVILGSDSVVFYSESSVERLTIEGIGFADERLYSAINASPDNDGWIYADQVISLYILSNENIDFSKIEYLVNLEKIVITYGGTFTEDQLTPIFSLNNLTEIEFRYDHPSDELIEIIKAAIPGVTVTLRG